MVLFSIYSDLFVKCGNAKIQIMCTNTDNAGELRANISFLFFLTLNIARQLPSLQTWTSFSLAKIVKYSIWSAESACFDPTWPIWVGDEKQSVEPWIFILSISEKGYFWMMIFNKSANFEKYWLDRVLWFCDFPGVFLEWLFRSKNIQRFTPFIWSPIYY